MPGPAANAALMPPRGARTTGPVSPHTRRSLLLSLLALSAVGVAHAKSPITPAPAPPPGPPPRPPLRPSRPHPTWGTGARGELLVVFAQEHLFGPGVPRTTLRTLVQQGPPSLVGLVAAYGLRIAPASLRAQRRPFASALAIVAQPPRVLAVDGQFLLPTLDEGLRADLKARPLEAQELDDGLFARVLGGESIDPTILLANARRLAIEAVNAATGVTVLRRLGYAQLSAWVASPPEGFAP